MYDSYEIDFFDNISIKIDDIIKNKKLITIELNELVKDQYIYINFSPDSLRYIYTLYPKIGKIESIDKNEISIINIDGNSESLLHDSVSNAYSNSLGYCYNIYLIT
jgi:hypothetical protein